MRTYRLLLRSVVGQKILYFSSETCSAPPNHHLREKGRKRRELQEMPCALTTRALGHRYTRDFFFISFLLPLHKGFYFLLTFILFILFPLVAFVFFLVLPIEPSLVNLTFFFFVFNIKVTLMKLPTARLTNYYTTLQIR